MADYTRERRSHGMKALLIVLLSCGLTFGMWGCAEKEPPPPEPPVEEAPEDVEKKGEEAKEKAEEKAEEAKEGLGDLAE